MGQKLEEGMSAEGTKLQLTEAQVRGNSEAYKLKVAGDMAQVKQAIQGVEKNFEGLEESGKHTTAQLSENMNNLNQQIHVSNDQIKKSEQAAASDVVGLQNKELTVLEKLASNLGQQQNKAKNEVEVLGEEFNQEIKYNQEQAEAQIGHVTQELDNLVGSTPDLSAAFAADTADTRKNLEETEKRIQASANRTDSLVQDLQN